MSLAVLTSVSYTHLDVYKRQGNHDSAKRIDFASDILAKHRVMIAGMPPLTREETIRKVSFFDAYGEVCIYLLPFVKPSYVRNLNDSDITTYNEAVRLVIERENIDTAKRNILVSHQFYTAAGREPETSDSEIRMVGGLSLIHISCSDVLVDGCRCYGYV